MKSYSLKSIVALLFLVTFASIGTANAQVPDLQVLAWQGSTTPQVETTYQYTTSVQNIGGSTAAGVKTVIEFPVTNTSPNKYILGKLIGQLQTGCTLALPPNRTTVTCNLGTMLPNETRSVTFGFQFQVATTAPTLKATASTTTSGEVNTANNSLAFTPALTYPDNEILFPVITRVRMSIVGCAGRGLTSFYECELAPSSITPAYLLDLNIGGTTALVVNPGYIGLWDQNTLPAKSLRFTIVGGTTNLEFNGYAASSSCFKGITTFVNNPTYNAAYRVCRQ